MVAMKGKRGSEEAAAVKQCLAMGVEVSGSSIAGFRFPVSSDILSFWKMRNEPE
jgi:hypothetical protein